MVEVAAGVSGGDSNTASKGRKKLSLDIYPDTSLAQARDKRDEARKHLAMGIDPSENRLRRVEESGTIETAHRKLQICG
ncbi:MAG: Arm DNA-binding domain-containing protein [Methylobacter sp.]